MAGITQSGRVKRCGLWHSLVARADLEQAMMHDGPALIDIAVNRQELAMPPSLKLDQIVDFNLYIIRAILNGRGDEIIDLARTNLSR